MWKKKPTGLVDEFKGQARQWLVMKNKDRQAAVDASVDRQLPGPKRRKN
jgi:hypothetical protein